MPRNGALKRASSWGWPKTSALKDLSIGLQGKVVGLVRLELKKKKKKEEKPKKQTKKKTKKHTPQTTNQKGRSQKPCLLIAIVKARGCNGTINPHLW